MSSSNSLFSNQLLERFPGYKKRQKCNVVFYKWYFQWKVICVQTLAWWAMKVIQSISSGPIPRSFETDWALYCLQGLSRKQPFEIILSMCRNLAWWGMRRCRFCITSLLGKVRKKARSVFWFTDLKQEQRASTDGWNQDLQSPGYSGPMKLCIFYGKMGQRVSAPLT